MSVKVIQEFLACGYPFSGPGDKRCHFKAEGIIRIDGGSTIRLALLEHMRDAH